MVEQLLSSSLYLFNCLCETRAFSRDSLSDFTALCSLCQISTDTVTARHQAFSLALAPPAPWLFLGRRTAWMLGNTPPWAIVTPDMSLFSSSSFLMANCRCLGMMRDFLLSLAALPASSRISAAK